LINLFLKGCCRAAGRSSTEGTRTSSKGIGSEELMPG